MAKGKRISRSQQSTDGRSVPEYVNLKVQILPGENIPAYYSNYIEVAHTEYEFVLSFAKVPSKLGPQQLLDAKSGQPLVLEPIIKAEIPLRLIRGLVRALESQIEKYETRFGKIIDSTNRDKE